MKIQNCNKSFSNQQNKYKHIYIYLIFTLYERINDIFNQSSNQPKEKKKKKRNKKISTEIQALIIT